MHTRRTVTLPLPCAVVDKRILAALETPRTIKELQRVAGLSYSQASNAIHRLRTDGRVVTAIPANCRRGILAVYRRSQP